MQPSSPALSMSSGSRADGRNWWRTDTPRSSFEVRVGSMPNGESGRAFPARLLASLCLAALPSGSRLSLQGLHAEPVPEQVSA